MKFNDAVWGALTAMLGAAILVHIRNFPTIPGQAYGPALFPGVIAFALLACGALLIVKGLAVRRSAGVENRWLALDAWTRSSRQVIAFFVVIGVNLLYVLYSDRIGFIIAGTLYLAAMFAVFRVRWRSILPIAIIMTLAIHYAFYKLLHVPLPWGVLERFAW